MGHGILSGFPPMETKRMLWVMGVIFVVILAFQYLQLSHGNVFSSIVSAVNPPVMGKSSSLRAEVSSSKLDSLGNMTLFDNLNSTLMDEMDDDGESSEEKDTDPTILLPEGNIGLNRSSGLKENYNTSTGNVVEMHKNSTLEDIEDSDDQPTSEVDEEPEDNFFRKIENFDNNTLLGDIRKENITLSSESIGSSVAGSSAVPGLPPVNLSPNITSQMNVGTDTGNPPRSFNSSFQKDVTPMPDKGKWPQVPSGSMSHFHEAGKGTEMPTSAVISIYEMNKLLLRNRASHHLMEPRWPSTAEQSLIYARSQIENPPIIKNDPKLYAPLYRNVSRFKRSYELMEDTLKVYIYGEGEKPILHQPVLKGIYASEGWFMKLLQANKKFVTKNPNVAHLFYLPFSSRLLEESLYVPNSHSHKNLIQFLDKYVDMIAAKHSFWNRTGGSDHFLVACHDWAPGETKVRLGKCIRALCNSDIKEGFVFGKDVSLPETFVRSPQKLLRDLGGMPPSKRSILAFFAGNMHGYLRPILLSHWENKDPDIKVFGRMPRIKGKMNYIQHMKRSKYCICAKGYEVNSPRVVEAIFFECVPVIISDNFVPPFFEILNWESFAVFILEKDIPNLKNILLSIPEKKYREMQLNVRKVQQHFLWHAKPVKYDIFHMILHSIWYNRVFSMRPT